MGAPRYRITVEYDTYRALSPDRAGWRIRRETWSAPTLADALADFHAANLNPANVRSLQIERDGEANQ